MKQDFGTLIEKYLDGELTPKNILKVENLIKTVPEFAKEFYLRRDLNKLLSNKKLMDTYQLIKNFRTPDLATN